MTTKQIDKIAKETLGEEYEVLEVFESEIAKVTHKEYLLLSSTSGTLLFFSASFREDGHISVYEITTINAKFSNPFFCEDWAKFLKRIEGR